MKPARPPDEIIRLRTLRNYEVLDTPPEKDFDDLALLAAQICQMPMAQISLVDEHRQWFKSRFGLAAKETPRDVAFCAHTILHADEVMEVRDARLDPRFADSPLVTADPQVRFYAGAPLVAPNGQALGALCVMDRTPRSLGADQLASLRALSRVVVAQLELRRQTRQLTQEAATRDRYQAQLQEQFAQIEAGHAQSSRMLALAEKSGRALLGVLEDERLSGQQLRASEERFRQVVENISEVFWMSDVEKNRIIYISPGYEHIWGRKCEALYASMSSWVESIQPEDRERVLQAATTKQASGDYHETYRIIRPDGTVRWIRDRAFPVKDPDGRVRRVVGVAEDITDQKKLEEQFLHAQRMEAIGTLASGVAHDLNNILSPMMMVAGILKESTATDKEREMLTIIERSARRGAGIIRQLLTFSRGLSGERIAIQPKHLVADMVEIMGETFPRNIKIEESMPHDLWTVEADPTQLHQVIMNLCVNARDAMPGGGKLTLSATNTRLGEGDVPARSEAKGGPFVILTVTDTGQGIPPEIIHRIFDPFFTTKGIGKGTGLGLSTVVGIIKSHRGFVTVESEPGCGTVFKVHLPAQTDPGLVQTGASATSVPRGNGETILLVDDEEPIRVITQDLLEQNNYRVLAAASGEEAIQLLIHQGGTVRLVLTDMMMPGIDGLALIRALRMTDPGIKAVACSGLDQRARQAEFDALGVSAVLTKPFEPPQLLKALSHALAEKH